MAAISRSELVYPISKQITQWFDVFKLSWVKFNLEICANLNHSKHPLAQIHNIFHIVTLKLHILLMYYIKYVGGTIYMLAQTKNGTNQWVGVKTSHHNIIYDRLAAIYNDQ